MRVYPRAGVLIRDPVKRDLLPQIGREVSDYDIYWLRRIADGDASTTPPAESSSRSPMPARIKDAPNSSDGA
jgi:hypothetical protein